jgi:hypothetical protein
MGRGITNNGIPWQQITGTQAQSLKEKYVNWKKMGKYN